MKKIILVSNRLPVTIEKSDDNNFAFNQSVGGLATGLSSVSQRYNCVWVGYPGILSNELSGIEKDTISTKLINNYKSYPVFLDSNEFKNYYNGFSNKTIWPLFHYFPYYANFEESSWEYYKIVNKKFFDKVVEIVNEDDIVWIHDYQLMLLPKLIKDRFNNIKIGFFLHIPFPSYEVFRLLPWREEILEGLLGADLVGFHTFSYVRHFLNTVRRVLNYENTFGQITYKNRTIKVDAIPMGIDYNKFASSVNDRKVKKEINTLNKSLKGQKIILSIDRLDYTKGLLSRLEAFDLFLTKFPEYIEKVTFIMVAVPSRTKIDSYNELKNRVNETIGRINGKYSKIGWSPIRYIYRSLNFNVLSALYFLSNVALITPLRDGMNLVAKEYLASKSNKKGVLVLSETAGVAEELGEAITVNPNDKNKIAVALDIALKMGSEEQSERVKPMQERLRRNTVFKWVELFIEKLENVRNLEDKLSVRILDQENKKILINNYKNSKKRLFLLDYDGTLTGFTPKIDDARPDSELYKILDNLIKNSNNKIVIVSGRNKDSLSKFFDKRDITLVAEHGAWIKQSYANNWTPLADLNIEWKKEIMPILEYYVDITPKSFIEDKSLSLVWHYRNSDLDLATIRLKELKGTLVSTVANLNLGIMDGHRVLEVKNLEYDKGKTSHKLIKEDSYDFILAAGDDTTDEDIFDVVTPYDYGYSIKIGLENSKAKFNLKNYNEMRSLLKELGDL